MTWIRTSKVRTFGTVLLESPAGKPSQVNSKINKYKIDVDYYNKTGKVRKIGGAEEMLRDNAAVMRRELDTLKKFEAVGSERNVAKRFGLGKTTAHTWHVQLRKMEGEKMSEVTEQPSQSEIEKFFTDTMDEQKAEIPSQSVENYVGLVQNTLEGNYANEENAELKNGVNAADSFMKIFGFSRVADAKPETVDDLEGLVEPEPPWTPYLSEEGVERLMEEAKKPLTEDEIWQGIREDLKELRDMGVRKVDQEIKDKLAELVASCN